MTRLQKNFCKLTVLLLWLIFVATGVRYAALAINIFPNQTLAMTETSTPAENATTTEIITPTEKPIHVLIVPGHEPVSGGAIFKGLKERDLAVALGTDLEQLLAQNPHFQVTTTRDTKNWNPVIADYFTQNWDTIIAWEKAANKTFSGLVANGQVTKPVSIVSHNKAATDVARRLYGINKWANENDTDIVISIHFDDDGAHRYNVPGRYSGFAIYEPSPQYNNYQRSREVAQAIFARLKESDRISNLPGEKTGIIDEPKLVAVGENNTSDKSSVLIEYGFIYEKKFTDPKLRAQALEDLAQETYQALDDYRIQKQNQSI